MKCIHPALKIQIHNKIKSHSSIIQVSSPCIQPFQSYNLCLHMNNFREKRLSYLAFCKENGSENRFIVKTLTWFSVQTPHKTIAELCISNLCTNDPIIQCIHKFYSIQIGFSTRTCMNRWHGYAFPIYPLNDPTIQRICKYADNFLHI